MTFTSTPSPTTVPPTPHLFNRPIFLSALFLSISVSPDCISVHIICGNLLHVAEHSNNADAPATPFSLHQLINSHKECFYGSTQIHRKR